MKNIIPFIKPNQDEYGLTHINCLEKPFGIAVEGLAEGYSPVFYMYVKLLSAYGPAKRPKTIVEKCELLLPKMGLHLNKFYEKGNMADIIKNEIDSSNPVLVPGNLRSLFYSYHYRASNWPHLFLITGYDEEGGIFFTVDGAQKKSKEYQYEEFVIQYPTLIEMYESLLDVFSFDKCFFSIAKKSNPLDVREIIKDALKWYLNQWSSVPEVIGEGEDRQDADVEDNGLSLFRNINHKEVFFSELWKCIHRFFEFDQIACLQEKQTSLIQEWRKIAGIYAVNYYRKKKTHWQAIGQRVNQLEDEMHQEIAELYRRMAAIPIIKPRNPSCWIFENNQDWIMRDTAGQVQFSFSDTKVYNSWISDESPKAWVREEINEKNFIFRTEIITHEFPQGLDYHAGIVFRTNANELFFWGIYRGEALLLQKIGDDAFLHEIHSEATHITMQLTMGKGKLVFGVALAKDEPVEVFRMAEIHRLSQVGLGCKTWGEAKKFEVRFMKPAFEWIM